MNHVATRPFDALIFTWPSVVRGSLENGIINERADKTACCTQSKARVLRLSIKRTSSVVIVNRKALGRRRPVVPELGRIRNDDYLLRHTVALCAVIGFSLCTTHFQRLDHFTTRNAQTPYMEEETDWAGGRRVIQIAVQPNKTHSPNAPEINY